jgi:hypothetical protein
VRQGKMVLYRPLSLSGKGLGIGVTARIFNLQFSIHPLSVPKIAVALPFMLPILSLQPNYFEVVDFNKA